MWWRKWYVFRWDLKHWTVCLLWPNSRPYKILLSTWCLLFYSCDVPLSIVDSDVLMFRWLVFRLMNMWLPNMKFDCRFVFSRLPLRLQHRAVELADENSLGDFLFPTSETACSRRSPVIPMDQLRDIKYVTHWCDLCSQSLSESFERKVKTTHYCVLTPTTFTPTPVVTVNRLL